MTATLNPVVQPVNSAAATGKAKELLDAVGKKLGRVPNMMATMAHAPAVLEAYLAFAGAIEKSSLSPKVREQIALAIAEANRCDYCVAAHTALGAKVGISPDDAHRARRGDAGDPLAAAILAFARAIVTSSGEVGDEQIEALRRAGVTDAQIMEIVAVVSLNIFTNYFNHILRTEVDFPRPA